MKKPTWTFEPLRYLASRLVGGSRGGFLDFAEESWTISPSEQGFMPRSFGLPGQLERVLGTEFVSDKFPEDLAGGMSVIHAATTAHLFRDVVLADGSLYHRGRRWFLHPGKSLPSMRVTEQVDRGAAYVSVGGLRYFGQWLIDDCLTYLLTEDRVPVSSAQPPSPHLLDYEAILGMTSFRGGAVHFRELVLFEDLSQNASKRRRSLEVRGKIRSAFPSDSHPGVFLLRGSSGASRVLEDERRVAERLAQAHGFRIVDPMAASVAEIVQACSGARVVVGVEGSHLVHGVMAMEPTGSVLCLMPPQRFCTVLRDVAQRDGGKFGYVVGHPEKNGFSVSLEEINETLALMQT